MCENVHCHGNFKIRSPFIFGLVAGIVRRHYRCCDFCSVRLVHGRLLFRSSRVACPSHRRGKGVHHHAVNQVIRHRTVQPGRNTLLFHLTGCFGSGRVLRFNPSVNLSALCLASCTSSLGYVTLRGMPRFTSVTHVTFNGTTHGPISLHIKDCGSLLPGTLGSVRRLSFIFFGALCRRRGGD